MKMKKLGLSALALFVMAVSAVTLRGGSVQPVSESATNAAYRDGLYLGKLAAEQGRDSHIASGRWSQENDRAAFSCHLSIDPFFNGLIATLCHFLPVVV